MEHFHVKDFKSKKHLSIPKSDFEISLINDLEVAVVDLPPDDEHTIINDVQIIGVAELDTYRSCKEPQTPPLGKYDCQLFDLCPEQIMTRVMLRHLNSDGQYIHVTCSAYGDTVYHLAEKLPCHQGRPS